MKLTTRFGRFGGTYVPEILIPALDQLEAAFLDARDDPAFHHELNDLLRHYAGRPTPLYRCRNLPVESASRIYLKREDLLHGGAHKANQALAQGLLARRMGKRRLIAETGAGQHGVATALTGAILGIETWPRPCSGSEFRRPTMSARCSPWERRERSADWRW